jgi:hypothetical protein
MPDPVGDLGSADIADLLEREAKARIGGSGIQAAALQGQWSPHRLWGRGSKTESHGQVKLLQWLQASLSITGTSGSETENLNVCNSVTLGPLSLRFKGPGSLQGQRPLLFFNFESLALELGGTTLLQRALPSPKPKRTPFFALIAVEDDQWLLARGRGGGLAIWRATKSP